MNNNLTVIMELQNLPHKWWKKNKKYIPAKEDVIIPEGLIDDCNMFWNNSILHTDLLRSNIKLIDSLKFITDITPTKQDYCYAINMELIELSQCIYDNKLHEHITPPNDFKKPNEYYMEIADVAIFCMLLLKVHYNITSKELLSFLDKPFVFRTLQPVYSWDPALRNTVISLCLWACNNSNFIKYKLEFNDKRDDHGNPRR